MKNAGGGWTYVARGSDITDGTVGSVRTDLNVNGIWHMSVADIAGTSTLPHNTAYCHRWHFIPCSHHWTHTV
jgi:hypothetical protein